MAKYARNVPDPFALVLVQYDSLLLSRAQVEALQGAQTGYRAQLDTVWNELASELDALGEDFNESLVLPRQDAAVDQAWELTRLAVHNSVAKTLTPVQMALSPNWVISLYRAKQPTPMRMYMP